MTRAPPGALSGPPPAESAIPDACCDRWADGSGRLALIHRRHDGATERVSFDALRSTSARLAAVLAAYGVRAGDRVAILLGQGPEALIAVFAALRLGAIAVPLGQGLRQEALVFRLRDSGAVAAVTDDAGIPVLEALRPGVPSLRLLLGTGSATCGAVSLWTEAGRAPDDVPSVELPPECPAMILYGTDATGHERGVLHAHRAIAVQAAALATLHGGLGASDDLLWTEADWAGPGGLFDAVLPALFHGVPVLAHAMPAFDPARALELMQRHAVRNAVLSPVALRLLRDHRGRNAARPDLRSIATAGGALDAEILAWARATFGLHVSDSLARPECGIVLVAAAGTDAPGSLGAAPPARRVAVIDAQGREVAAGTRGEIALHPDDGCLLRYWQDPEATDALRCGPWIRCGAEGIATADGQIMAAAPVVAGEGEVETFLLAHPAVARAAVIGDADATIGPDATAIVVPARGAVPGPDLADELRGFLRARLSIERCPRRVAFARDLPVARAGFHGAGLAEAVGLGGRGTL